ncbi:YceI family protein [Cognatitamlana onchidii]|uniref:YceI family protein n=1 Tax=Cognatitamlana onchidii TaxID=2562860 RepID=UPI0010A5AFC0|nr:YceI family protein [Algibacter onchidii]
MKKTIILLIALTLGFTSCKKPNKESKVKEDTEAVVTDKFVVKPEATSVNWTAYKTTEKKGVGGEFSVLKFDEKEGSSVKEALNGLSFSIPVSNLFTKDAGRDAKIKEFFFGAMLNTELIKGQINYIDNNVVVSLTMNNVTHELPMDINISDERRVSLKGTMNLADWDALNALASLNKVCYDLHKGPDGISKTWEDVAIEVNTYLRKS